mmetsp:Transcript_6758/g.18869  ORF Transcript_6758/g.18869 Transcript_6758/m.18869 type:complete len:85 (+) Transcript_6758:275-529(+)
MFSSTFSLQPKIDLLEGFDQSLLFHFHPSYHHNTTDRTTAELVRAPPLFLSHSERKRKELGVCSPSRITAGIRIAMTKGQKMYC